MRKEKAEVTIIPKPDLEMPEMFLVAPWHLLDAEDDQTYPGGVAVRLPPSGYCRHWLSMALPLLYQVQRVFCSTSFHMPCKAPQPVECSKSQCTKRIISHGPSKNLLIKSHQFFSVSLLCYQLWHVRHRQGRQMLFPVQVALQLYLRSKDFFYQEYKETSWFL